MGLIVWSDCLCSPIPLQSAHTKLNHHQLVTTLMVGLAPLQLGAGSATTASGVPVGDIGGGARDVAGAEQMLNSAGLLTRNNGDVSTRAAIKKVSQYPWKKAPPSSSLCILSSFYFSSDPPFHHGGAL